MAKADVARGRLSLRAATATAAAATGFLHPESERCDELHCAGGCDRIVVAIWAPSGVLQQRQHIAAAEEAKFGCPRARAEQLRRELTPKLEANLRSEIEAELRRTLSTALDTECRRAEYDKGRHEGYAAAQAVWEITLEAERARAAELTTETAALAAYKVLGTAPASEQARGR